jgi:putative peptidoglycan lipid II flippase
VGWAAALLAVSVLASRLLGLVRDRVLAHQIGNSAETDAYGAAFLIPDILNYFLAGGALSIAFIPLYAKVRNDTGPGAAQDLLAKVLGTMTVLAVLATGVLWTWAEPLVALAFPDFTPETRALTVRLTRIVLPAQIFFVAGGIVRAALMAEGRFASQALAPVVYNLGIIAGGGLAGGTLGAEGFAWGALVGAFVGPFAIPLIELARRTTLRLRARVALFDRDLLQYLLLALPLMLGVTLLTVDEWYDKVFGARLGEGTLASLGYARRLMQVPVAVVGQTIATAALPVLSRLWSEGRGHELNDMLLNTLRAGLGLALLGAVGAWVFAHPLVAVVYETGRFTAQDSERVAALLAIFSWAVPAWIVQQIAVRAFYARSDMWRPMLLGTAIAVAAIPLYLAFGDRWGGEGIALAGVVAMSVNAVATLALARVLHHGPSLAALAGTTARAAAIALLGGAAGEGLCRVLDGSVSQLLLGGAGFAAVALAGVFVLGDAPLRDAVTRLLRRVPGVSKGR